jgi:dihydrofolate synthase/folylpolyglutamate synthase
VGVGGRYDATNALDPILSVITPISFDHADVIGPTIADIAYEKSGVMREDRPVIIAHQPTDAAEVIGAEAARVGARAEWVAQTWSWRETRGGGGGSLRMEIRDGRRFGDLKLPLLGEFQRENATVATAAVLGSGLVADDRIDSAVRDGLANLVWPGRVHVISHRPRVIFDGAHNAESARQLVEAIRTSFSDGLIHWVVGMSRGKDVVGFLDAIRDSAHSFTATTASHVRSMPAEELAGLAQTTFSAGAGSVAVEAESDPVRAFSRALEHAAEDDIVCATGSFFLLGDLYSEYAGHRGI